MTNGIATAIATATAASDMTPDEPSSDFEWNILECGPDGWARVEYAHELLGRVTKQVFIPMDQSPEEQRGAIAMHFPSHAFHARWLAMQSRVDRLAPANRKGTLTYRFSRSSVGVDAPTIKV
jgi:hypothetical protein